jgi:hypothetical protein
MTRALTVKVPTAKVIKALDNKLIALTKEKESIPALEAKYQTDHEKWLANVKKIALANQSKGINVRVNVAPWKKMVNIDYDIETDNIKIPEEPTRDWITMADWEYKNAVEEITNALNILRMTDEPVVNASTMKSIAKYL